MNGNDLIIILPNDETTLVCRHDFSDWAGVVGDGYPYAQCPHCHGMAVSVPPADREELTEMMLDEMNRSGPIARRI